MVHEINVTVCNNVSKSAAELWLKGQNCDWGKLSLAWPDFGLLFYRLYIFRALKNVVLKII